MVLVSGNCVGRGESSLNHLSLCAVSMQSQPLSSQTGSKHRFVVKTAVAEVTLILVSLEMFADWAGDLGEVRWRSRKARCKTQMVLVQVMLEAYDSLYDGS